MLRPPLHILLKPLALASVCVLALHQPIAYAQINLPVLGSSVVGNISTQQEYEYGREFLRGIRKETLLLNDPLISEYIAGLTYKLAANSELTDHRLEFALIDSDALNAFAAPGGVIGVNAGLFLYADNEGQFASVLSHELAHLSQRHYARTVEQSRNSTLPNIAGLLASVVIAAAAGGEAGQAALMANQARSMDNQLRFSRSHEQEADRIGIRTLVNAGFDPQDMASMFEGMLRTRNFSQKVPEFLSTHPLDENRIADSRNRALSYSKINYVQNPEFLLMRERVKVHYSKNLSADIQEHQRDLPQLSGAAADAARYGIALAELQQGNHLAATETLAPLLKREPSRITYVLLQADIAVKAGDYDRALSALGTALKVNPDNHPLTMSYATALTQAKRYNEAADVLEQHAINNPDDVQLWYDLAEVAGLAGNIELVHQARAEYFICIGEFARAKEHINFALDQEPDRLTAARLRQRLDYIRNIEKEFYH